MCVYLLIYNHVLNISEFFPKNYPKSLDFLGMNIYTYSSIVL
jgi:hypothetical protein